MSNRILIVITQAENAGAQKATLKLYDYLISHYSVRVLYLYVRDADYYQETAQDHHADHLMGSKKLSEIRKLLRIRQIIREEQIEIVFTYTHWSNILVPLLLTGLDVKIIAGKRGALRRYPRIRYLESYALSLSKVRKVVCVSKSLVTEAVSYQRVSDSKVLYIPNGINASLVHPSQKTRYLSGRLKILFVGRLHEQKGIRYLMEGFKELVLNRHQDAVLSICGDGELHEYVVKFVSSNGLQARVELNGNVRNISDYYRSHDVLVSTSLWEGFPNVLLEAAIHDLPIIATSIDGSSELIEHEQTGYLIKPCCSAGVANSLVEAMKDYRCFVEYAQHLRKKISTEFDDSVIREKYLKLVRQISETK